MFTMARHGKCITRTLRKKIVDMFLQQNKSKAEIARELRLSENTVYRWVARWDSVGSIARKRGQGRKTLMSKRACFYGLQLLVKKHLGAAAAAKHLHAKGHVKKVVSPSTLITNVKNYAKNKGTRITCKHVRLKRKLTAQNKSQRLDFCRTHRLSKFLNVMFTDRCKFSFNHPGEKVVTGKWYYAGQDNEVYTVNHPHVFNVYGGITIHGATCLIAVTGTTGLKASTKYTTKNGSPSRNITIQEYYNVLMQRLLPAGHKLFKGEDWVLQQDNDPTHKEASKRAVQDWNKALHDRGMKRGRVSILENWPPNSPDLSIIENCWSIVQTKVASKGCADFAAFKAQVQKVFSKINPEPLFKSIPKRIKQCLKAKGGRTPH